jgi:hypothetical protein
MSTTTERNKAVIQRFIDAWNSRQPDAFDDLIAPNVIRHCEATGRASRLVTSIRSRNFCGRIRRFFKILSKRSSF